MSAVVLVTRKTPHFRHTKPAEQCDPDDALHTYAIRMIQQAHSKAVERGDPYMLTRPCKSCLNLATEIDFADSWECAVEKSIAEHTRSDLAFSHADGRQIAVEVVVTHMMESETEAAYKNMGLPVAIIRPNWETVNELLDNLQIEDSRNFDTDICSSCKAHRNKVKARFKRRRETVDKVLSRMARRRASTLSFRPWYNGKHRTPMYPQTQKRVFAAAIIITELGFVQHNSQKPWLFRYPIHKREQVFLYADLGGSDVVPIYKDTAAMLYAFGPSLHDDDEYGHAECCSGSPISHYIIEEAGKRLQQFGVDVRTGFIAPEQIERVGVHPLKEVDNSVLSRLIKLIN